ncbi:hypothetical protein LguiA_017720 [Lonicera macranthoides]
MEEFAEEYKEMLTIFCARLDEDVRDLTRRDCNNPKYLTLAIGFRLRDPVSHGVICDDGFQTMPTFSEPNLAIRSPVMPYTQYGS